ncbi:hypothetical protein ACFQY7_50975 [Actinomadura luteofluorescens]|uniref:hypothetical protein n=1 Tax=Actinomadura luteofluorescens TaxID=46163 RepID=UPI00363CA456
MNSRKPLAVCVFCSSSGKIDRRYVDLAAEAAPSWPGAATASSAAAPRSRAWAPSPAPRGLAAPARSA